MEPPVIKSPEQIVEVFVDAWNERDAHTLASIFIDEAEFVNVTGLWWHNKKAIFKAHDYGLKVIFNNSTLKIIRTKVKYLTDEVAIIHAKTSLVNQTSLREDEKTLKRSNILIFVVKKENDIWRCHATQNTEIIPGKETWLFNDKGSMEAVNYNKFKTFNS